MENTDLLQDVEQGEVISDELQQQASELADLQGTLEALAGTAIVAEPRQPLTAHQQERVDDFKTLAAHHHGEVYGVMDKAALKPGTEGFVEMTTGLFRKVVGALGKQVPIHFQHGTKALLHYVTLAERLRARLLQLRPVLAKRDFPISDVFDYGAYSRFFQCADRSIGGFSEFAAAMEVQNAATRYTFGAAQNYSLTVAEKLLESLEALQALKEPDAQKLEKLRDAIEHQWIFGWREAQITTRPGQTPRAALNAFPERKFVSLAPLLDNRYLVAHCPKYNGGAEPNKITHALQHYGASVVFDKEAAKPNQHSMNVPNIDELVKLLDDTVHVLTDFRAFEELAEQNKKFAKDFDKAMGVLNKLALANADLQYLGFVTEYFKITNAVAQAIQQPYAHMAWMYIRCALVITALVELACLEPGPQRVAATRFFAKQSTEFANPAMESYALTARVLQAAQRAAV